MRSTGKALSQADILLDLLVGLYKIDNVVHGRDANMNPASDNYTLSVVDITTGRHLRTAGDHDTA